MVKLGSETTSLTPSGCFLDWSAYDLARNDLAYTVRIGVIPSHVNKVNGQDEQDAILLIPCRQPRQDIDPCSRVYHLSLLILSIPDI